MRLIVGISGASGVIMGYQMLKALKQLPDMEVHLIITEGAVKNFECETNIEKSADLQNWPILLTVIKIWQQVFPAVLLLRMV